MVKPRPNPNIKVHNPIIRNTFSLNTEVDTFDAAEDMVEDVLDTNPSISISFAIDISFYYFCFDPQLGHNRLYVRFSIQGIPHISSYLSSARGIPLGQNSGPFKGWATLFTLVNLIIFIFCDWCIVCYHFPAILFSQIEVHWYYP
jgi:hypothetical protein